MTDRVTTLTDLEVLTSALLEIQQLLSHPQPNFLRSSYRARVRAVFLLLHFCSSNLSPSVVSFLRQESKRLADLLRVHDQVGNLRSDLPSILLSPQNQD